MTELPRPFCISSSNDLKHFFDSYPFVWLALPSIGGQRYRMGVRFLANLPEGNLPLTELRMLLLQVA